MKPARTKSVKTVSAKAATPSSPAAELSAEKLYWLGPLDAEQVRVVSDALDFYARILIGQFGEITDLTRYGVLTDAEGKRATEAQLEGTEALLNEAKRRLTGFPSNASKGIGGQHTPAQAQHAFLLRKVIRHRLALERKPDGGPLDGVDFDDPYLVRYTPEKHRVELTSSPAAELSDERKLTVIWSETWNAGSHQHTLPRMARLVQRKGEALNAALAREGIEPGTVNFVLHGHPPAEHEQAQNAA